MMPADVPALPRLKCVVWKEEREATELRRERGDLDPHSDSCARGLGRHSPLLRLFEGRERVPYGNNKFPGDREVAERLRVPAPHAAISICAVTGNASAELWASLSRLWGGPGPRAPSGDF